MCTLFCIPTHGSASNVSNRSIKPAEGRCTLGLYLNSSSAMLLLCVAVLRLIQYLDTDLLPPAELSYTYFAPFAVREREHRTLLLLV
jgi:hypothetical protein